MREIKACRVCLARDVRLEPPEKDGLQRLYELLAGFEVWDECELPLKLCVECGAQLRRCAIFREKCKRADDVLRDIFNSRGRLTAEDVLHVDRGALQLTSRLKVTALQPFSLRPDTLQLDSEESVDIKDEDNDFCIEYVDADVKKEEAVAEYSPLAALGADDAEDSDGSMKDEPLSRYKRNAALNGEEKVEKEKKKEKSSKKNKHKTLKKKLKTLSNAEPDEHDIKAERKSNYPRSFYEEFATVRVPTREEQIAEIEKRKESSNYINSPYKCNFCYKGFIDDAAFRNHMLRHDASSGDFECDICRRRFKHLSVLKKHITGNHTRQYICKKCDNVCSNPCQARMHEMWHNGKVYQCTRCEETFVKFTSYMGHVRKKHPSQYVCEICGNAFVSEKGIYQHKSLMHQADQTVPEDGPHCAVCDIRFATEEAHGRHLACSAKHIPANDTLRPCATCGLVLESRALLREHARRVHPARGQASPRKPTEPPGSGARFPGRCQLCPVEVNSGREYWQHFRRYHKDQNYPKQPGSYTCEVCGRSFKGLALLQYHMRRHTGDKPYACTQCDKSFMMAEYLTRHRRVHTGEKPYPCAVCGKRYQTKSNLDKHRLTHTGEKRHSCELCGKTFKVPYEKRAHVEHVHFKKPWPKRDRSGKKAQKQTGLEEFP